MNTEGDALRLTLIGVGETDRLGRLMGELSEANQMLALDGPLGAGKTALARGVACGANVADMGAVNSPTYVIMNIYPIAETPRDARMPSESARRPNAVYHFDAYRVGSVEDFAAVGFEEALAASGLVMVEWAELVRALLPEDRLEIALEHGDTADTRVACLRATGPISERLLAAVERGLRPWEFQQ